MGTGLRVCVTGGAGFIGSHLCRALIAAGHSVTAFDNLSVGRRENLPAGVPLVVGDILDGAALEATLRRSDAVCHLAARVAVRSSFEFVVDDATTNVAGTASVLQAARRAETVRRVVSTSSMAVYAEGKRGVAISEEYETNPTSPYGVSKLAAERLTHLVCREAGLESVVLRLFNTYGPGQRLSPYVGVATIFMDALRRGEPPVIFGDGEQSRDFVHVSDVAAGFAAALVAPVSGETLNIGSGVPLSVNQLLSALGRAMNVAPRPIYRDAVPGELRYSLADIARARARLHYTPKANLEQALVALVDCAVA